MDRDRDSTILALDLGTKMGWAVLNGESISLKEAKEGTSTKCRYTQGDITYDSLDKKFVIEGVNSGWVDFSNKRSNKRFEGGGMRYLRFIKWLDETRDICGKIEEIYFEEVARHCFTNDAQVYGGFLGTLTAWCEEHKIPYAGVPVKTIKKHITGNGNAKKQMVIDAVKTRGYEVSNDNEADAIALLLYVRER